MKQLVAFVLILLMFLSVLGCAFADSSLPAHKVSTGLAGCLRNSCVPLSDYADVTSERSVYTSPRIYSETVRPQAEARAKMTSLSPAGNRRKQAQ